MPIATSPSALSRPASFTKMEDRKRPASSAIDDGAPPNKRQATVNGSGKTKDDSGEQKGEEAWIEVSVTRQPRLPPRHHHNHLHHPHHHTHYCHHCYFFIFLLLHLLSFPLRRGSPGLRPRSRRSWKAVAGASHHRRDVSVTDFSP
ncbi:hypothetical protein QBC44DRAFT_325857 [Cladorrhinum sp. PSN332]|nr:hypothetical protein QBC44DRAFT_325857 [Cladorrhinum sp. PSN332]